MGKRGQNEGSIYKHPDGRWTSVINLGYEGGKLKRQYFYGKTREGEKGCPMSLEIASAYNVKPFHME
jgi:hypothetical protein